MDNNITRSYKFKATDGIENIIESWAKNSGFYEAPLPKQLDENDVTYCFSLDEDGEKTLLTVNILDGIVHIETWIMASTTSNTTAMSNINDLLIRLNDGKI